MPLQSSKRPLGAFLKAFQEQKIDCILIGMMAAVEQGALGAPPEAIARIISQCPAFMLHGSIYTHHDPERSRMDQAVAVVT